MPTVTKAGRYEIVGELGRGAMGVVYKAVDPVIGRTVAVKTIRLSEEGTGLSRPELLTRFQTEARAAGLLTHPNIVVVFDAGEDDGLYYITMELVEGKSLQALLDDGHGFPLPRTLRIMEQTCSALQFAHERNVIHRDIKPANLMLTADDTVKVTDFGTAKILQFGTVQQTAHVMGTPSYMSPEQVKGRAVDGRSDIFSLGVMLYEMVTSEKPFPGQNITTVIYKIVNEDPVPPRQIDPSIHAGLSAVVMKALAKEPDARYQSCREMLEDLRNYRSFAGAGNTEKTMVFGGAGMSAAPDAAVAVNAGGGRAARGEPPQTATAAVQTTKAKLPGVTPENPAPKRIEPAVTAAAAEYKGRIEKAAAENGLKGRVKVQASNNTLTVGGKLRPGEHREMLQFLRNAPTNVRGVDHIEYDDTPDPAATNDAEGGHPVPTAEDGGMHVMFDVIGATTAPHGPAGQVLTQRQTACSVNTLKAA